MSDVSAGAVMTLVIPLALLMVVLGIWAIRFRRAGEQEVEDLRHIDTPPKH
jgi:cytochrome c-type biogenesis protein CcmH/NrfF